MKQKENDGEDVWYIPIAAPIKMYLQLIQHGLKGTQTEHLGEGYTHRWVVIRLVAIMFGQV